MRNSTHFRGQCVVVDILEIKLNNLILVDNIYIVMTREMILLWLAMSHSNNGRLPIPGFDLELKVVKWS